MNFNPDDPIFPPGIPEEFKEEIKKHQSHTRARLQDNTHAVRQLLDELDSEQLIALDIIIADVSARPKHSGSYWRGQVSALQWTRHNICPCGENHDPNQVFDLSHVHRPGTPEYMNGKSIEDVELPPDLSKDFITTPDNEVVQVGSERWNDLMDVHSLVMVKGDGDSIPWFQCKLCGKTYPTLQDRMLKPTCAGCAHKEKWG